MYYFIILFVFLPFVVVVTKCTGWEPLVAQVYNSVNWHLPLPFVPLEGPGAKLPSGSFLKDLPETLRRHFFRKLSIMAYLLLSGGGGVGGWGGGGVVIKLMSRKYNKVDYSISKYLLALGSHLIGL